MSKNCASINQHLACADPEKFSWGKRVARDKCICQWGPMHTCICDNFTMYIYRF